MVGLILDSDEIFFCLGVLLDLVSDFINVWKVILLSCNSESDLDILLFELLVFEDLYNFAVVFFSFFEEGISLIVFCMNFLYLVFFLMYFRYAFDHFEVLIWAFLLVLLGLESSGYLMVAIDGLWDVFEALGLSLDFGDVGFATNFL